MIEIEKKGSCFIAGNFCEGDTSAVLSIKDKFHGSALANLSLASEAQVDQAIESSTHGHKALIALSAGQRSKGLHQLASLVENHKEAMTRLIVAEAGKPRGYAEVEVDRAVATFRAAAEEAIRFSGEVINIDHANGQGRTAITRRVARGPVAAISPFNFPLNLAVHKIAPAIAVGCSVILKPSPFTPLTTLYLAALFQQTDLPQDALNVVVCQDEQAQQIVTADAVAMVSFTGSDSVGWHIKGLVPKKPCALELGGNAAVIVDQDADVEKVATALIGGAFLYAGQICISTQRVYVHSSLYEEVLNAVRQKMQNIIIGDPSDKQTLVGPMIDTKAYQKVASMVQEAVDQGATIVAQTSVPEEGENIYPATLVTNTKPEMRIVQEEAFAPVCVIEPVDTLEEGIHAVNNSRYGLQVGVFSDKLTTLQACFHSLEVGGIIMNDVPGFRVDAMPYGGVKDSGLGREGPRYAMEEMTEPRLLVY